MKNNFKLILHDVRKKLNPSQYDIDRILFENYQKCDDYSEIETVSILEKQLDKYIFHNEVQELLETLKIEITNDELTYELKDLYHKIARHNQGKVYNYPLNLIANIISTPDQFDRINKIINELKLYDWVPEIKIFMNKFHSTPLEKVNAENNMGGVCSKVYSFVETVNKDKIFWISDKWFHLSENGLVPTTLDIFFEGEKLESLNRIQEALSCCEITDDRINFTIDDNLVIGVSVDKKGKLFINDKPTENETTLESLFNSPLIPFLKGSYYPIILEVINNIDKFMELDICIKVTNITNPHLEVYVINWEGDAYAYRKDKRYGTFFTTYESALELVEEIKNELNCDLTFFFPEKLTQQIKNKQDLEDKEQIINIELKEIKESLKMIEENKIYLNSQNPELVNLYDILQIKKIQLEDALKNIQKEKIKLNKTEII